MNDAKKPLIGFIGQGWIGKNYANDFEARGYRTVRYSLEEPYIANKDKVKECDIVFIAVPTPSTPKGFDASIVEEAFSHVGIVFIAVPTPSTPKGFDASIVEEAFSHVGAGKIAIVKSTILPGTTKKFQEKFPDIVILYAPEFLSEATAAHDAAHPFSNIIGMPIDDDGHRKAAQTVLDVLPAAPFTKFCSSTEAELVKYSHNASGYVQIVLFNMLYDLAHKEGANWENVQEALLADPYICNRYAKPVHKSGRGAGGGCFIKDFAALRSLMEKISPEDTKAIAAMKALECKNIELLMQSNKDPVLLRGVYGDSPETVCGS